MLRSCLPVIALLLAAAPLIAQGEDKTLSGRLEAARSTDVRADLQAYAGELRVKWTAAPGLAVKAGDKLAELEAPEYDDALVRAREGLVGAELALAGLKDAMALHDAGFPEQYTAAQRRLERAREELKFFKDVDRAQQVRSNELNLENSRNNIEDQEEELRQLERLYKGNDLAKESQDIVLNRSKRRLAQSKERHKMSEDRHERWIKVELPRREQDMEAAVKAAELEMQRMDQIKATGNAELRSRLIGAERRLSDAKQYLAKLEADAAQLILTAPHDGFVVCGGAAGNDGVSTPLKAGDKTGKGQVIVAVIDASTLVLNVPVLANAREKYQPGTKVSVKSDDLGANAEGTVKAVGMIVKDGKVTARVEVANTDGKLLPGARAAVSIP